MPERSPNGTRRAEAAAGAVRGAGAGNGVVVVAVGGLVASGKSTVARRIAASLGAERVAADAVRGSLLEHGEPGAWRPEPSAEVYDQLLGRARDVLAAGRGVVLDATFPTRSLRADARRLAADHDAPFRFVECRVGQATCRERLRRRQDGRGWLELFEGFLRHWEPVDELPREEHLVVDTSGPPGALPLDLPLDLRLGVPTMKRP